MAGGALEERAEVWTECVSNPQGEHRGKQHEDESHHVPESPLDNEHLVTILESPTLVHDRISLNRSIQSLVLRAQKSDD